jgi:hypothetical protein
MSKLDPLPSYTIRIRRLDPTVAELHIEFPDLPADVEVRGRLMGPRCPGSSTVEVAYHLQRIAGGSYRVIIPEPVLWSRERQCVYAGPVEFHRGDCLARVLAIQIGLRQAGRDEPDGTADAPLGE